MLSLTTLKVMGDCESFKLVRILVKTSLLLIFFSLRFICVLTIIQYFQNRQTNYFLLKYQYCFSFLRLSYYYKTIFYTDKPAVFRYIAYLEK